MNNDGIWLAPDDREAFTAMCGQIGREQIVERLWARDPSVWHPAAETQARISARLGWLDLPGWPPALTATLDEWRAAAEARAVLYVAPGSAQSIARLWRGLAPGAALTLLDTIDPASVQARLAAIDWRQTAIVCAATERTPELAALARIALAAQATAIGARPPLLIGPSAADLAADLGAHPQPPLLIASPADISERFGALAPLGLIPALLCGFAPERLLEAARAMRAACQQPAASGRNPGARLGVFLGALAQRGRDKLTLLAPPALAPVATWIAAFVGGALGKHRRGFVPIVDEPEVEPAVYRRDRLFVVLRAAEGADPALDRRIAQLAAAGQPILSCALPDPAAVAAHLVCWQVGVAIAASIIGLNPFDEPDTVAMRGAILRRLDRPAADRADETGADLPATLAALGPALHRASWAALALYAPPTPEQAALLRSIRALLLQRYRLATVVVAPWRDHAYAVQLLHAGRLDGLLLALLGPLAADLPIPGANWSLADLARARLAVELAAWARMGRSAIPLALGPDLDRGLRRWLDALARLP